MSLLTQFYNCGDSAGGGWSIPGGIGDTSSLSATIGITLFGIADDGTNNRGDQAFAQVSGSVPGGFGGVVYTAPIGNFGRAEYAFVNGMENLASLSAPLLREVNALYTAQNVNNTLTTPELVTCGMAGIRGGFGGIVNFVWNMPKLQNLGGWSVWLPGGMNAAQNFTFTCSANTPVEVIDTIMFGFGDGCQHAMQKANIRFQNLSFDRTALNAYSNYAITQITGWGGTFTGI